MESYLLKGIFIGLLFGMPVGAVGTMTAQRTLNYGIKAGLITGLGSSIADCLYACIGAFGLTFISDFLLNNQTAINILGGSFIVFMGVRLIIRKEKPTESQPLVLDGMKMFLSSFVVGVTNPASILTFIFAFSYFGISGQAGIHQGIQLVCGVFIGTYIWWGSFSSIVSVIRKKAKNRSFQNANKVFGAILILFSVVVFIRTIL